MIRLAGAGQVADHQVMFEELQPVHGAGQHHGSSGRRPRRFMPVSMCRAASSRPARVAVPGLDLRQAVEHRRQAGASMAGPSRA
jgi:hypothetical protein